MLYSNTEFITKMKGKTLKSDIKTKFSWHDGLPEFLCGKVLITLSTLSSTSSAIQDRKWSTLSDVFCLPILQRASPHNKTK